MISLDLLKQALQPLEQVGKKELEVDAFGTKLVLRPLLPREEVAVQRQSAIVVSENKKFDEELREANGEEADHEEQSISRASALDYFDRFRIEVLAYAIVQIGEHDLRNQEYVATGELLKDGVTPVKVSRQVALRNLISDWSRAMIAFAFGKYGELIDEITKESEEAVEKSPADLDVEIERLQEKLNSLKEERASRAAGDPGITADHIQEFVGTGNRQQQVYQDVSKEEAAPQPRRPVVPPKSAPPTPPPPPTPVAEDDLMASMREEERILQGKLPSQPIDPLSQAKPAGTVGGVEAYRLPTETLSERGRKNTQPPKTAPSTANPNFRPPKR